MTTENDKARVSDNELIAQFMGRTYGQNADRNGYLKYNISWDHLMPVVEKIEQMVHEVDIYKNACEMDMKEGMIHFVATTKIEATYKAVVQFIKWHNEQQ